LRAVDAAFHVGRPFIDHVLDPREHDSVAKMLERNAAFPHALPESFL
jgi:hypothetical protein